MAEVLQPLPVKWQKYLRLVDYDFITVGDLERDIHRDQRFEETQLIRDLADELERGAASGCRYLYVIKLVSLHLQGQLPNMRIQQRRDLRLLPHFLARHSSRNYVEVWYCRTRID